MTLRSLGLEDLKQEFFDIYSSPGCDAIPSSKIEKIFKERIHAGMNSYVLESKGKLVASATMLVETKFFREGSKAAHLIDLTFHPNYQGSQLNSMFITSLKAEAIAKGCYKIILNCSEDLIPFFESQGFEQKELQMMLDKPSQEQENTGLRRLKENEVYQGFDKALSALRPVDVPEDKVSKVFQERIQQGVKTYVLEKETDEGTRIVATASLIIEHKLDGKRVGHIEDVAVNENYQGKGFGKMIMSAIKVKAAHKKCDQLVLDCSDKNLGFYINSGYKHSGYQMRMDLA